MKHLLGIWVPVEMALEIIEAFFQDEPSDIGIDNIVIPSTANLIAFTFAPDRLAYFAIFEHESFPCFSPGGAITCGAVRWRDLRPSSERIK